jgi:hypothetical protein
MADTHILKLAEPLQATAENLFQTEYLTKVHFGFILVHFEEKSVKFLLLLMILFLTNQYVKQSISDPMALDKISGKPWLP